MAWPEELPEQERRGPRSVRERLLLGASVGDAVATLPRGVGRALAPVSSLHLSSGGDMAAALDGVADAISDEIAFLREARAASAGAKLSAWLVAGLPLAFVPFSPAARDGFGDTVGLLMLLAGVTLSGGGLRWIARLVPAPPPPDPVINLCCGLAGSLRAGLSLTRALAAAATHPPAGLEAELRRATGQVRLGRSWRDALASTDGLDRVARVLARVERAGTPVAAALEQLASTLRAEQELRFKTGIRRAPVLMVVPLTCCILPAYGFLAIGPFLRSVALG